MATNHSELKWRISNQLLFAISFQNVIVLDLSQDISSTTTSTTTTTATTESPIGVGNNVLSGKTKKQTKNGWMNGILFTNCSEFLWEKNCSSNQERQNILFKLWKVTMIFETEWFVYLLLEVSQI